ncbi:hypothetical protein GC169_07075 [bacterium]|nr:hypothetical protein [bacterium]
MELKGQTTAPPGRAPPTYPQAKWRIKVGDEVYGPYSRSRLIEFLKEGRVLPTTLVAIGEDNEFVRADRHANLRWNFEGARKRKFGEPKLDPGETEIPVCNYFIAARLVGDNGAVEAVLKECGKYSRIAGDMWVARSRLTIQQLRARISAILRSQEQIVIVNATKDRLAWFNLGMEGDLGVRSVWDSDE